VEVKPPAYLSPSRLATYDRCPQLFYERYILKLPQAPHIERLFGIAVHRGLEAHFRGLDHELTFLLDWRNAVKECAASGIAIPNKNDLTARGLDLIEMVRALNLSGEPEQKITCIAADLPVPFLGVVDLVSDGVIYDYKTTAFGWTQQRADTEPWQPAIYSQAYAEAHDGDLPRFEFIILPRVTGPLQRFESSRTFGQIYTMFERARAIYQAIEAKQFECIGTTCREHQDTAA
jgi:hypothetical protein